MEILNQFGVNPILLIAQAVNFFILLFILKRLLYKPILKVLEERKKRIEESLRNAEEIEKRLTQIAEKEAEAIMRSAKEGQKIIKEAEEFAAQTVEEGKKEYERIINQALEDAKRLRQVEALRLEQEVKGHLGDLVALGLEKVTGKIITEKQKKDILEKEIRNLS